MTPLPHLLVNRATQLARRALRVGLCSLVMLTTAATSLAADMPPEGRSLDNDEDLPKPLTNDSYQGLLSNSPFTRSLGMSDSLILTGVAKFNNEVHATLLDTQTMESHVVTKTPNREGWQLIAIGGDPAQMHTWTAKIQMQGGQITVIRYQKPPPRPARAPQAAVVRVGPEVPAAGRAERLRP